MDRNKKRLLVVTAVATLGIGVTFGLANTSFNGLTNADRTTYGMSMSKGGNLLHTYTDGEAHSGDATLKTDLGNDIAFSYTDVKASASGWQTLASGGSFYNVDPIHGMSKLTLSFLTEGAGYTVYYSYDNSFSESTPLTSSSEASIIDFNDYYPNYFKLVNTSGADLDIASIGLTLTCTDETPAQEMSWNLVTDTDQLVDGSNIVFAYAANSHVAGALDDYLAAVNATFSGDKSTIESLPATASVFTLEQSNSKWAFKNDDGYLTKSGKNLAYSNSVSTWSVSVSEGDATIDSGDSTYNLLKYNYNQGNSRFKNYSSTSNNLEWVQIYQYGVSAQQSSSEETSSEASSEESTEATSEEASSESQSSASSEEAGVSWSLVQSTEDLVEGDYVVFACNTKGVVATPISSGGTYLNKEAATFSTDKSTIESLPENAEVFTLGTSGSNWTFESSNGLLGATAVKNLAYSCDTTTWTISVSSGTATIQPTNEAYGYLQYNASSPRFTTYSSAQTAIQLYRMPGTPVYPTAIALSGASEVQVGKTTTLTPSFTPTNANQTDVTWSSSNESVASVSNGVVTGVALGEATITATVLDENGNELKATHDITVSESVLDAYTVMIYLCGSNLESYDSDYKEYGSQASDNLKEIMQVADIPENVNILVETGGANNWDPSYASAIGATIDPELTRWTVQNQKLVKESNSLQPADGNMGSSSTFQDFLEWGIENYPAQKTGVIMWNHGGAMDGSCFDERYSNDSLTPSELVAAADAAFTATDTEKLEWIGYDCCLMGVQDIAELNSDYFNYQISSQETEPGGGWDYDGWLPTLTNNPSVDTPTLGQSICDTYYEKTAATYASYASQGYTEYKNFNDVTLSVLDLTKMSAYKAAFESFASDLTSVVTSSTKWNTLADLANSCERYGLYEEDWTGQYNNGYLYDVFNLSEFFEAIASSSTFSSVDVTDVQTALDDLIVYNAAGKDHGESCGLSFFMALSGYNLKSAYSTSQTRFTTWRDLNIKYGDWYSY